MSLDEDRILRNFLNVTLATVRTNYYQRTPEGEPKPYLSFKFDPSEILVLPLPRPSSRSSSTPRMEGVHLRGGRVARGGIRWSDRREDFRTEVLGLMKAQMVKNAVIVPVGAKGGFVVKRPPTQGGREALQDEVIGCYKTLIRGMLDLTDNLAGDRVVPPEDVVRYDEDDPYLVVAADKGTATFSDIANGISEDYGFWLGDAFASGGAHGYDHKEMGITAKGAWESVKRHFRELGMDIQNEDFTVAGIGDMSGDVFGNGMLLSRHIKLVGAFNHLHIFLDPNPDPETSFEERERLFKLPRSSWSDYDESLISEGGGVFSRTAKSIPLSPQVREMLGVEEETLTPNEVIRALLKAKVDLLFNGGIGTYVKSSEETQRRRRGQDQRRRAGGRPRARVPRGRRGREPRLHPARGVSSTRWAAAHLHGRHRQLRRRGLLGPRGEHKDPARLRRRGWGHDGEAAQRAASRDDRGGGPARAEGQLRADARHKQRPGAGAPHDRRPHPLHTRPRGAGSLNRELEFLPSDEALAERRSEGIGLTAPEFAILLSYTKITLYKQLRDSDLPEDPYLSVELERYFPTPLRERFREEMREHRLRREITATCVVNDLVNRGGPSFAFRLGEETGAAPAEIARAYTAACDVFDMRSLWDEIESLDNVVEAQTQTRMLLDWRRLVERATRWFLRNRRPPLDISATVAYFSEGVSELTRRLPEFMLDGDREGLERATEQLVEANVPPELARRVALLERDVLRARHSGHRHRH